MAARHRIGTSNVTQEQKNTPIALRSRPNALMRQPSHPEADPANRLCRKHVTGVCRRCVGLWLPLKPLLQRPTIEAMIPYDVSRPRRHQPDQAPRLVGPLGPIGRRGGPAASGCPPPSPAHRTQFETGRKVMLPTSQDIGRPCSHAGDGVVLDGRAPGTADALSMNSTAAAELSRLEQQAFPRHGRDDGRRRAGPRLAPRDA